MSIIPSTFSRSAVPYTVVGGSKSDPTQRNRSGLTVLMLNRSGRFYRSENLRDLQNLKLGEIICLEGPQIPFDIEPLSRQLPRIRFLLLQRDITIGEKINLGIEEARFPLILVIWSDMRVVAVPANPRESEDLCLVPLLKNHRSETIPSLQFPALLRGRLSLIPWEPAKDGLRTITPFDYCGVYHQERFRRLGGFDGGIRNPYWQKLDLGFRAYLWGEQLRCRTDWVLKYSTELVSEDTTADSSYKQFYLRNMAVRHRGQAGVLPYSGLLRYVLHSDTGPLYALQEYREARKWVQANRLRFKTDAQRLISQWQPPE